MEDNKEIEIDLRKIFEMLKHKIGYILVIGAICGILAGCLTNIFITPQYTATVKLYVQSNSENLISSNGSISQSEYQASEMLVNTYLVIVESDTFLEKVAAELDSDITANEIKSMLSCSQIEDTVAFSVSITNEDPELAATIANVIADTCPSEIVRILKVGGVEPIDYAKVPTTPSSPNLKKNVLIGTVAGLALSFAFFLIKELFDTSISDEEDLTREFSIPIIGTVPKLIPVSDEKKSEAEANAMSIEPPKPSITNTDEKGGQANV